MTTGAALMLVLLVLYFLPVGIAIERRHANTMAIAVCNLLFGWTMIGWGISMIWAVKK
jgi:hypothetical protein